MNVTRIWLYQLSDLPVALVSEIPPESPLWAYSFYVGTKNNPALGKTFQMLNEDELRHEVLQAGKNVLDHVQRLLEQATNGFIEGFESHPIHQQLSGSQLTGGFFAGAGSLFQQALLANGANVGDAASELFAHVLCIDIAKTQLAPQGPVGGGHVLGLMTAAATGIRTTLVDFVPITSLCVVPKPYDNRTCIRIANAWGDWLNIDNIVDIHTSNIAKNPEHEATVIRLLRDAYQSSNEVAGCVGSVSIEPHDAGRALICVTLTVGGVQTRTADAIALLPVKQDFEVNRFTAFVRGTRSGSLKRVPSSWAVLPLMLYEDHALQSETDFATAWETPLALAASLGRTHRDDWIRHDVIEASTILDDTTSGYLGILTPSWCALSGAFTISIESMIATMDQAIMSFAAVDRGYVARAGLRLWLEAIVAAPNADTWRLFNAAAEVFRCYLGDELMNAEHEAAAKRMLAR